MPYEISTHPDCPADKPHAVLKVGTDERMGCHASEEDARKQIAALHAQEDPMTTRNQLDDDAYAVRSGDLWPDAEFAVRSEGSKHTLDGYPAVFNSPSRLMSIQQLETPELRSKLLGLGGRRFREVIHPGAFAKSLSENPDISLRYQHNLMTLPLARTTGGTLTLTEDAHGVRAIADLPDNEWGRPVRDAIARGDITSMSMRFLGIRGDMAIETLPDGYRGAVRHVVEAKLLREVSLVDSPAYFDTPASVRDLADGADLDADELAEAFRILRDPEARLTITQRDLLMAAINPRTDEPFVPPKLARARERLAAFAN